MLTVVVFLQNEDTKEVYQAFAKDVPAPGVVTAIEPITADNIKVYPNPSDQEFTIELPSPAQPEHESNNGEPAWSVYRDGYFR